MLSNENKTFHSSWNSIFWARNFNHPTRAFNFATPAFRFLTRGFELVTRRFELVTCKQVFYLSKVISERNVKYLLKSYYWEKLTFSYLRFSKFKKFVTGSVFRELQLTQMSLNFTTSCWNLKIKGLGAKVCAALLLFWFWKELWSFKVKESLHFVKEKYKL